jgi:hypothetical protein
MEPSLIERLDRIERLLLQSMDATKPPEPTVDIRTLASELYGSPSDRNARKIRHLVSSDVLLEGEHWCNTAGPNRRIRYRFYVQACRDRLNTKTHSR